MKWIRSALAILAVLCLAATGALAQGHSGHNAQDNPKSKCQEHFQMMDTDRDGFVSLEEYKAMGHGKDAEKTFKKMDANGDGKISPEEMCGK